MEPQSSENNPNIIPPVQPTPEPEKTSSLKSKWLKIGVVIIVLLIFGAGTYFLGKNSNKTQESATTVTQTPTPASNTATADPTASWKTYIGIGFTFKYPSNFYLQPPSPRGGVDYIGDSKNTVDEFLAGKNLNSNQLLISTIRLNENYDNLQSLANRLAGGTPNNVGYETTEIDGIKSAKVISNNSVNYGIPTGGEAIFISANPSSSNLLKTFNQILSTFKFTNSNPKTSQSYLDIPDFGVKIPLSGAIKDAYYTPIVGKSNNDYWIYLKVHSLDSEPYCTGDNEGVAALNKVPNDEIDQKTGQKYLDEGNGSLVGDYYYFIDQEQAVCSQNTANQTIETTARKAFGDASKTITAL